MMPQRPPQRPQQLPRKEQKPRKENDNCEIEFIKTGRGKRIRFKGKCSPAQISLLSKDNVVDIDDSD